MELTGKQITALMRKHHITIRDAAAIFDITLKRVRTVRAEGVSGDVYVWEWGTYLPVQHHRLQVEQLDEGREGHPSWPATIGGGERWPLKEPSA